MFLCICVCLFNLKEETAPTSRSRMKGSIKEAAKDKDKKGRESQKGKRRPSAKTKTKGSDRSRSPPLHSSSMSYDTEQDLHQANLELKRNQGQENIKNHFYFVLVLCRCYFANCVYLSVCL